MIGVEKSVRELVTLIQLVVIHCVNVEDVEDEEEETARAGGTFTRQNVSRMRALMNLLRPALVGVTSIKSAVTNYEPDFCVGLRIDLMQHRLNSNMLNRIS